MPDIFDQVAGQPAGGAQGDIFDQVGAASGNLSDRLPDARTAVDAATNNARATVEAATRPVQVGSPQILAEDPTMKGPAMVRVPSSADQQSIMQRALPPHEDINPLTYNPIPVEDIDRELSQFLVGPFAIHRGIIKTFLQLPTPANAAIAVATGGASALAESAPPIAAAALKGAQAGLSAYFATKAGQAALQSAPRAAEAYKRGDTEGVFKELGEGGTNAALAFLTGKHAVDTAGGASADVGSAIEAHNERAGQLLEQDRAQGQSGQTASTAQIGGQPAQVRMGNRTFDINSAGASNTGRRNYRVVDSESGKTVYGGYADNIRGFLQQRGAQPVDDSAAGWFEQAQESAPIAIQRTAPTIRGTQGDIFDQVAAQPQKEGIDVRESESAKPGSETPRSQKPEASSEETVAGTQREGTAGRVELGQPGAGPQAGNATTAETEVTPPQAAKSQATQNDGLRHEESKSRDVNDRLTSAPREPVTAPAYGHAVDVKVAGEQTSYPARYAVREASDVVPSHNPQSFEANPAYEHQNDRDYSQAGNAARVVENSAQGKFSPDYTLTESPTAEHGAPVIDPRGNALGGNNRTMTIQRVYARGGAEADAYKQQLAQKAQQFGIRPEDVQRFTNPVLVRELAQQPSNGTAQRAITDFNKTAAASLSPAEQAVADGRRLSAAALGKITGKLEDTGEESTMAQALRGEDGAEVMNALVRDGVVTEQEKNGYIDERGNLTPDAKDRIGKMIVGRLFGSPAEFSATPPELRAKLERVAPHVLRVEGREGWGITPQVREAVSALTDARGHRIRNLDDLAQQQSIPAPSNTGESHTGQSYSPEAIAIAKKLQEGPLAAQRAFRQYANDEALSREGAQSSMFEPPTKEEAFQGAFGEPRIGLNMRPFRPYAPFRTDNDIWEQADVRFKKQAGGAPGHLFVNRPAVTVMRVALERLGEESVPFLGTTWNRPMVRAVTELLEHNAPHQQGPIRGAFERVAAGLRQVLADHKGAGVIVEAGPGRSLDEVRKTVAQEEHHRKQMDLVRGRRLNLVDQGQFFAHPLAARAAEKFGPEYAHVKDRSELIAEMMAEVPGGTWDKLGLSKDEAAELYYHYAKLLLERHGARALGVIRQAPRWLREQINARLGEIPDSGTRGEGDDGEGESGPRLHSYEKRNRDEQRPGADSGGAEGTRGVPSEVPGAVSGPHDFGSGRGEPLVLPSASGERGAGTLGVVSLGLDKFVTEDVAPTLKDAASAVVDFADDILKILAPAARGRDAKSAALIMRGRLAELARRSDQAEASLAKAKKFFDRQSAADNYEFIHRMESAAAQNTPDLDAIARVFRTMLDTRRAEVQALGKGKLQRFYENYFPHVWQNPKKAQSAFASFFGRRPLEGGKSFLKQRTHITFADGLAAGLKPVSDNPVDLVILKSREMDRYMMAHQVLEDWKGSKLAKFVDARRGKSPKGWMKIDDPIGTVYGQSVQGIPEFPNEGVYDSLQKTADALGLTHRRTFNMGGPALGYARRAGIPADIETRHGTGEEVLAHEIGHHIEWKYDLSDRLINYPGGNVAQRIRQLRQEIQNKGAGAKQARVDLKGMHDVIARRVKLKQELRDLADLRFGAKDYVRNRDEKMAAIVQAWAGAREQFKKVAPTVYDEWTQFLGKHPELQPLRDLQGSMNQKGLLQPYDVGGLVIKGHWWAPEGAARIMNNYLTPGLRAKGGYRALIGLNNVLNQFQLGLSAFHLGFTSADAAVSKAALGFEGLMRGKPIAAAKAFAGVPAAPLTTFLEGQRGLREWMKPGSQGGAIGAVVKALESGGARAHMDEFYQTRIADHMRMAFRHGNVWGGLLRAPFAGVEAVSDLIMKHVVPAQKWGVAMDLARFEMERLGPGATFEETRAAMAKVWDSVENRMGQLTYDNLFWNRTAKDLAMLGVRSVGWNLGTLREIGGGGIDLVKEPIRLAGGTPAREVNTHRIGYLMGLVTVSAIIGALYQKLATGKGPEELKDYFFPKTGELDEAGRPQRVSLPTYVKDVYHYATEPGKTLAGKVAPIWSTFAEMIRNEDFYGNQIRNADDPLVRQMTDEAKHVVGSFEPFGARNIERQLKLGASPGRAAQSEIGITPAPAALEKSKAERLAGELAQSSIPAGGRTKEQAARRDAEHEIAHRARAGQAYAGQARDYLQRGVMTTKDLRAAIERARLKPLAAEFQHMGLADALKVWDAATPEERRELRGLLAKKARALKNEPPELERTLAPKVQAALAK